MSWLISQTNLRGFLRHTSTRAFNGAVSFIPVCGYRLARRTHAPDLVWAAGSIAVDADQETIGASTLSGELWGGASMLANSPTDFWTYAQGARYNTFAFRGAQMDAYGNVNNSVIGAYDSPTVRLPGGGGMADLGCMIPRHLPLGPPCTTRVPSWRRWTSVPASAGATAAGIGPPSGCPAGRNSASPTCACSTSSRSPSACGSPRCTRASASSRSRPPPASRSLLPAGDVPATAPPSADELHILRTEVDPTGACRREF